MNEDTRFWNKVNPAGDCWLWTAALTWDGYGRFRIGTKTLRAHRVAWAMLVGEPPAGLVSDHLCRVRNCVNTDHIEWVTTAENLRRSGARRGRIRSSMWYRP